MKEALEVLNRMVEAGVIGKYAISGAVAAYNYIEASVTEDLDILVTFDDGGNGKPTGLLTLGPIVSYLAGLGYTARRKEGLAIGGWPIRFLPVSSVLDTEALDRAIDTELEISQGVVVSTRILRPEHLVAIALKVGRPKDRLRVASFLEENAVDPLQLQEVLSRYELTEALRSLSNRIGTS